MELRKNVLITGGNGDIAIAIGNKLEKLETYNVFKPGKEDLDVTDIYSIEKYFQNKKFDIVINNAGYIKPFPINQSSTDNYLTSLNVNLVGVFHISNIALKINANTFIINIGSSAATKAHANWSAYCAAKSAVSMATQCWHMEGIKTICLSPGRTATKMRSALFPEEDQAILLSPDDFASVVIKAINMDYELGQNLNVNIDNIRRLLNE